MPRPRADVKAMTEQLLREAEYLLEENGGRRLVLSDVANRVGISQSYVHRFFPTKADLVRALAKRWFKQVQEKSDEVANSKAPAALRLEQWVLAVLGTKREAYDRNPSLFMAYLDMANDHQDLVLEHLKYLETNLRMILTDLNPNCPISDAMTLVKDATLLFRTPHNIARYRVQATDERAKAVVRMLISTLTD